MRAILPCLLVLIAVTAFGACKQLELPPVGVPPVEVTDDDRQVMAAVLRQILQPQRDEFLRQPAPTPFLLFDATIPTCDDFSLTSNAGGYVGCISAEMVDTWAPPTLSAAGQRMAFQKRNRQAVPLGKISDDVMLVPSRKSDEDPAVWLLARHYDRPANFIAFSLPLYGVNSATIAYRWMQHGGGFASLARRTDKWVVTSTRGWHE